MKKPAGKTIGKAAAVPARAAPKKASAAKAPTTKAPAAKPVAAKTASAAKPAKPAPAKLAVPPRKVSAPVSAEAIAAGEALIARFSRHSSHRSVVAPVSRRPFFFRRDPMENIATAIIGLGFLMMFQPFLMQLYTWSFVTMLFGTAMFIIVSKFPE